MPGPRADRRRSSGTASSPPRLTDLIHYPVKSCRGASVERAEVVAGGLRHDRRWMVVDDEGRFLSQRTHPRLCLVRPTPAGTGLELDAPGMEPLVVADPAKGERIRVEIWDDRTAALDAGSRAAGWLGDFLGVSCRLVRHDDHAVRTVDPDYARGPDDQVAFADGFPFLLTSEASLAALNERLPTPLPMNRFRPNLVVSGAGPFAEDGWRTIRIGSVTFSVVKPCARCKITTVDQETGETGKEPLKTLADFRRGEQGVEFGQNLIHHGPGTLEAGAEVEVLE